MASITARMSTARFGFPLVTTPFTRPRSATGVDALDAAEPYDICIVGTGIAGITLGTLLARMGIRTLLLESGWSMASWLFDKRVQSLADYDVTGDADYPTKRTKARLVGGNSNFWTGRCERFHASDFEPSPYQPEGNPWPFRYADIEPYYDRAERILRVRGGELSEHMPARSGPLPLPARGSIASLQELFSGIGVTVDVAPTATPSRGLRFFRAQNEILPDFIATGFGTLVSGVTVTRLINDWRGTVTGAEARTLDGDRKIARARLFVVACGGIETPRLLLLSRSDSFPNGIGNGHDRVGRGFNEHPSLNFYGKINHSRATAQIRSKIGRIHQFYDAFRPQGLGSIDISTIQSWVFPNHLMPPADLVRDFGRAVGRVVRPTLYMGPNIEMKPVDDNRVTLSKSRVDAFGNPIAHLHLSFTEEDRQTFAAAEKLVRSMFDQLDVKPETIRPGGLTWSRHHIGTCRLGHDPRTSVVDPSLRVHESPNLYLTGSEVFATGGAVTPVLTIIAMVHRLAEYLPRALHELDMKAEPPRQEQPVREVRTAPDRDEADAVPAE